MVLAVGRIGRGWLLGLHILIGKPVCPGRHDDITSLGVILQPVFGQQLDQFLIIQIGKVIEGQDAVFSKFQHHTKADIFEIAEIVGNLEIVESLVDPLCLALDELNRPRLQFLGDAFVETLNGGQLLDRCLGNLFREDKTLASSPVSWPHT